MTKRQSNIIKSLQHENKLLKKENKELKKGYFRERFLHFKFAEQAERANKQNKEKENKS